ncbi:MAG: FKBP-type peptidyl-prolyl cis-trans isomerase [Actinobacteria bacterium]|nr:FKBP-type peptidyl-prolyl cis-trans isomerase [Actinomycetota bacterium]
MRFPRPARLAPLALAAALLVTACGDAAEEEGSSSATTAVTDSTTSGTAADGTAEAPATTVDSNVPPKPTVEIPTGEVTELVVTALVEGEGEGAKEGDTVVVHYVGVRSEDGTEFDNSYDRGEPLPVALGSQSVIPGWEQGLLGVKAGGQYQLDIPAELAYGDNPQGDIIQAGDALSFVVDVMAIIPATDPADAPDVTVEGAANRDELLTEDLVVGDGKELELGQTAYLHLIAFRGDTGEQVASSWETGQPQPIQFAEQGSLPGIIEGMAGMKVGGSRKMIIPFVDAFGSTGNPDLGIPADTDLVLVIDLIAIL